jgi:hypothetical protein
MDHEGDGRGFAAALDNPLPSISPACPWTVFLQWMHCSKAVSLNSQPQKVCRII